MMVSRGFLDYGISLPGAGVRSVENVLGGVGEGAASLSTSRE